MPKLILQSGVYPVASTEPERRLRVVTLGGGHGQANVLSALRPFDLDLTAIVPVTDEGGCSGQIRRELGLPPPGDARRCLSALADRKECADYSETRENGRSYGNLLLAGLASEHGIQFACDAFARWAQCRGRVVPIGLHPGTLRATTTTGKKYVGELAVDASTDPLSLVSVSDVRINQAALSAFAAADLIVLAPGSVNSSLLAVLCTPGVVAAIVASQARVLWLPNIEVGLHAAPLSSLAAQRAWLERHWRRNSGHHFRPNVLLHGTDATETIDAEIQRAPLAVDGSLAHDPALLTTAFRACGVLDAMRNKVIDVAV